MQHRSCRADARACEKRSTRIFLPIFLNFLLPNKLLLKRTAFHFTSKTIRCKVATLTACLNLKSRKVAIAPERSPIDHRISKHTNTPAVSLLKQLREYPVRGLNPESCKANLGQQRPPPTKSKINLLLKVVKLREPKVKRFESRNSLGQQ